MHAIPLETDYLVIGAGAMGMAFVDSIISHSDSDKIVIVDRFEQPGGHWNHAYPFVRLHQPSAFYGVNSRPLGENKIDIHGLNKGYYELASGSEVCAYFDQVMQKHFLPSGRVNYFPMCNYLDQGKFFSLVSGNAYQVSVNKSIVDATYTSSSVPATHHPTFEVAEDAHCIPPNKLAELRVPYESYTVLGSGKTAIDTCLWLLSNGVSPSNIHWIRPRDPWLLNREHFQPGDYFFKSRISNSIAQFKAILASDSMDELFENLEDAHVLIRLDTSVSPTMYKCATVTEAELGLLRSIKKVTRLGRVKSISPNCIRLERGEVKTSIETLHIDCTAGGLARRNSHPIFDKQCITLQAVRLCQPTFSASLIGFIESVIQDNSEKQKLCQSIPYPNTPSDWLTMLSMNLKNQHHWNQNISIRKWLEESRLNLGGKTNTSCEESTALTKEFKSLIQPSMAKIEKLLHT